MALPVGEDIRVADHANGSISNVPHICLSQIEHENPHSFQYHLLTSGYLTLKDGSAWNFDAQDFDKMREWAPKDRVVIVLADESEKRKYKIVNLSPRANLFFSIPVNLQMGPHMDRKPVQVTSVDALHQIIHLNNGNMFKISSSGDIHQWRESDVIILGMKNSPKHSEYKKREILLINPRSDQHVCASPINQ